MEGAKVTVDRVERDVGLMLNELARHVHCDFLGAVLHDEVVREGDFGTMEWDGTGDVGVEVNPDLVQALVDFRGT